MLSPFCEKCGSLIKPKRGGTLNPLTFWCPNCRIDIEIKDTSMFQEHTPIEHTPRERTRILENESPPIPKIFTQTYEDRRKKRCHHPQAVFKGFYQFSRGDEASRKYWYCPDCGQVFRFSGKFDVKPNRRLLSDQKKKVSKK